jgi:hypothetical protein
MSDPPESERLALAKLVIQGVLALVVLVGMVWIILSPVNEAATKGALVIISSAAGFLFGRHSS